MGATRRLNINLPSKVAEDLEKLATDSGRSMTDVVRTALGLVKIAQDVTDRDQKLIVADSEGKPLREIVLPR
jgi:Arc/MetJ-type ribon-helix-helix transcriptional regulator